MSKSGFLSNTKRIHQSTHCLLLIQQRVKSGFLFTEKRSGYIWTPPLNQVIFRSFQHLIDQFRVNNSLLPLKACFKSKGSPVVTITQDMRALLVLLLLGWPAWGAVDASGSDEDSHTVPYLMSRLEDDENTRDLSAIRALFAEIE